ncbi:MAG: adenylosuccinate lyase [Phycisphaerales bacterium]|nr:MAG: adenylosuccinate lyase [Phycisphaerales bacterium]
MHDTYTSPLAARNASEAMLRLWSPRHKFNTWRRIWLAVAEAQHETGLPVRKEQVEALRRVVERGITDAELARASELERELRHDVMAHVHCLAESCPEAGPIIHLGCTSQDVVCNADLLTIHEALHLLNIKVVRAVISLGDFAEAHASLPTLGFTHYQAAQPVTVGRRAAMWASDLDSANMEKRLLGRWYGGAPLRGLRGATGTQASFAKLYDNPHLANHLEKIFLDKLSPPSWEDPGHSWGTFGIVGQTYPRIEDARILSNLALTAAVLHKIATDIRLLSNRKEIDEPFGSKQIGSSAMPYKRNPMKCERICGLTRFVMNLVGNAYDTAATQWLERTLDDSSNRRLSLPEAFLALDGALDLMHEVASGLVVHEAMVRKNLMAELPFLATENILMEAVKAGGDRQELHEVIRVHAQASGMRVKQEGLDNDLLERLQEDPHFKGKASGGRLDRDLDWEGLMDPMRYVGRSVHQTHDCLQYIEYLRSYHKDELASLDSAESRV